MGQPNPPGDMPLIEGLDPSWNDIVKYVPEDKRGEFTPMFKERIGSIESQYEPLKQWEDFQKSGITPEFAGTAVNLFNLIENDPKQVYEAIGNHLGLTPAEAKAVAEDLEENGESDDPRLAQLQQQVETLSQIMLAQRQQTTQEQQAAEQDKALEKEISDVKKKYGADVPEDEILMRMLHKNMTAEQAYQEYSGRVTEIQKRRPSPMVMGSGGAVPAKQIDVKKLNTQDTKSLVAQMIEHANSERRQ